MSNFFSIPSASECKTFCEPILKRCHSLSPRPQYKRSLTSHTPPQRCGPLTFTFPAENNFYKCLNREAELFIMMKYKQKFVRFFHRQPVFILETKLCADILIFHHEMFSIRFPIVFLPNEIRSYFSPHYEWGGGSEVTTPMITSDPTIRIRVWSEFSFVYNKQKVTRQLISVISPQNIFEDISRFCEADRYPHFFVLQGHYDNLDGNHCSALL